MAWCCWSVRLQTATLRERAGAIVQGIEECDLVHNELTIAGAQLADDTRRYMIITTKVKARLIGIKGFDDLDPSRVKVVTENGTVFLMGLLYQAEADAVTERASQVGGVQKVVKLFEYLD